MEIYLLEDKDDPTISAQEKIHGDENNGNLTVLTLGKDFDFEERRQELFNPIPWRTNTKFLIIRKKSWNGVAKEFQFYDENSNAFLLSAIKLSESNRSNFQIRVHKPMDPLHFAPVGALKADKKKKLFTLWLLGSSQPSIVIEYTGNSFRCSPRSFDVQCYPNGLRSKSIKIEQVHPIKKNGTYRLYFGRSDIISSIKNFVLKDEGKGRSIIFGRKSKKEFLLDVRNPFSVIEGFALALAQMNNGSFQR
jgi:hypothetical protein